MTTERGDDDDMDFAPSRLRLERRAPAASIRALLWLVVALLSAAVMWACFGRVDVVTAAPGRLVHPGKQRVVRAPETARVTMVRAAPGLRVHLGAVLVELRNETLAAERTGRETQWRHQRDEAARLQAQLEGLERLVTAGSSGAPAGFAGKDAALAAFAARLRETDAAIERATAETAALAHERRGQVARLALLREQLAAWAALATARRAPGLEGAELRQQVATAEATLAAIDARTRALQRLWTGRVEQRLALIAETRAAWSAAHREATTRATESEVGVAALAARVEALQVAAPIDGVVLEVAVNAAGEVVQHGDPLVAIVPDREPLLAEVWIGNRDFALVRPGQRARLKLDSYPFTRHGTIDGTVEQIAADAVEDAAGSYVYRAVVRPELATAAARGMRLVAGMTLSAEVVGGRRRLVEYLLAPLLRYRDEVFTEP